MVYSRTLETFDALKRMRSPASNGRVLDVGISIILLMLVLPLIGIIALIIKAVDGGPILFAQRRIGLRGRSFLCFKFRTMVPDAQQRLKALLETDREAREEWARDHKLKNDPRLTRSGVLLRKLSLDELPQFFNVLRGEMSLVGPRPIVPAEVIRYGSRYWAYCAVRPGITGIWQISGRNDIPYRRRIAMDAMYARNFSTSLYLRILLGTGPALVRRRGAY